MARLNKNESFAKNSILNLSKIVNDEESYNKFINSVETVFNAYDFTEEAKEEIKNECFKIIKKKNFTDEEILIASLDQEFADFRTVSEQDYVTLPEEKLNGIKKFITKKRAVAGGIILAAGVIGITAASLGKKNESKNSSSIAVTSESNVDVVPEATPVPTVNVNDELNPLLSFNPEDKQVMKEKMLLFIKDALPKGYKIKKSDLATEVEDLINFYIVLNMDNLSSDMLLKLYQSDNIDVNKLYDSTFRVLAKLDKDAQVSRDNIDVSKLISDKEFAKHINNIQVTSNKVVKASIDKDKKEATKYSKELSTIIKNGINNNNFRKYSANNTLLSLYLGAFPAANSAKTLGLSKVVMTNRVADMVYVQEKCETALKQNGSIVENYKREGTDFENGVFSSLESAESKVNLARETAISFTEEEKNIKYANEESFISIMNSIIKTIEKENILSTYDANPSYRSLYYKNLKVMSLEKSKTITKAKIIKSKTAKKITKKKKVGKKVTVKDISSKDFKKGSVIGKNGKAITTTSKAEQQLVEEANTQGYSDGYSRGMSQGSQGKSKTIGNISVPSKFASNSKAKDMYISQFKIAFSKGYSDGYSVYKENKDYKKEVPTGSKTEESDVYDKETVSSDKEISSSSSSSSSSSVSNSSSSSSSSSSKTEESDVYDVEDMPIESNLSSSSNTTKSVNNRINELKKLKNSIASLNIEQPYEQESSYVR